MDKEFQQIIDKIQEDLYKIMGEIGSKGKIQGISKEDVEWIESLIKTYVEKIEIRSFVLPGSTLSSAKLDICRTIARRAERRLATVLREYGLGKLSLIYVNRLSDLLYLMARYIEIKEGKLREVKR
ncbi:hypothetical protein PF0979 [Pyrococcus furiosus DSM 3638]|uniref:Cobalamin adenosyltransferase-like domain-containing protein n=1 Tax=Pyrococcus furiosus (strain ATCC 43587 / DSM 3638 / JCM 8422 / Vc1) TaxID=186497 RepID=Q8U270_PYRFU|nr:hypothetical protein PF0979 [Pyrococcus furiosus DSM 3638]